MGLHACAYNGDLGHRGVAGNNSAFGRKEVFKQFLEAYGNELKKEFYIPYAVDIMMRQGTGSCDVLSTPSRWFGVTFREDRPAVVAKFKEFAETGVYPTPLYQ